MRPFPNWARVLTSAGGTAIILFAASTLADSASGNQTTVINMDEWKNTATFMQSMFASASSAQGSTASSSMTLYSAIPTTMQG
jgi:hypothetical protein